MKDLLLYIAQNLVEHPEQVSVTEVENGDELTLQLRVAPEDMGKVIGAPAPRCLWISLIKKGAPGRVLSFCPLAGAKKESPFGLSFFALSDAF